MKRSLFNRQLNRILNKGLDALNRGLSESEAVEQLQRARESTPGEVSLSRRHFIGAAAAAALAAQAACTTRAYDTKKSQWADRRPKGNQRDERVLIVGGGLAGLTCAYRLSQFGFRPMIFEASERLGGRVFTRKNFNSSNQFCELGAELVDSTNTFLIELASELGLETEAFGSDGLPEGFASELFFYDGKLLTEDDLLRGLTPLLASVKSDLASIFPSGEVFFPNIYTNNTAKIMKYDNMSLAEYFDSKVNIAEDWILKALAKSYETEYGGALENQSALNFLSLADTDLSDGFTWYGSSDEWGRIRGGNSGLIEGLLKVLEAGADIYTGQIFEAISGEQGKFVLSFRKGTASRQVQADRVVFALPFSVLRKIEGFNNLKQTLSKPKQKSIDFLSYGTNAKFMTSYQERYWRQTGTGQCPASQGLVTTDLKSGQFWETSRAQPGKSGTVQLTDHGILTNFLGGRQGASVTTSHLNQILDDVNTLWPGLKSRYSGQSELKAWAQEPFALGSYTSPSPGQYTSVIGSESSGELGDSLFFVGEHTSLEWLGFMEGAAESGTKVAHKIAGKTLSHMPLRKHRRAWRRCIVG